ncbi:PREDICTED: uncharacterized protein LOC108372590 isoform X2 [Rhagoletis zephyria]|uniref:uncharacterized protein LOC108372590 isoform X1 n=1 Tax=Rhagoletis zephyria TaxID=28612 RepID=UPI0008117C89|nr:PREDICTED: uncharacterized protein LOC108372590 isoform X1 [Rhagoletis zephyria]XP_017483815.1 PREDICTED: uncharacterized protein LOC108372590 isoform X2 [Rhagoletis zephyria]
MRILSSAMLIFPLVLILVFLVSKVVMRLIDFYLFLAKFNNLLILGDFNAKNRVWGESVGNFEGKLIFNEIRKVGFMCLNDDTNTFSEARNNSFVESVLDLSFTNSHFNILWSCSPAYVGGSHHHPISIVIEGIKRVSRPFICKYKHMKALSSIQGTCDSGDVVVAIKQEISKATVDLNTVKFTPKEWWNKDLRRMYRRLLASRKKRLICRIEDMDLACVRAEEWKKAVKGGKSRSFKERIYELNSCPNSREAWRLVNNIKGSKYKNVEWIRDDNERYLNFLKDQVCILNDDLSVQQNFFNVDPHISCSDLTFSLVDMDLALSKKKRSAAGQNCITFEMLKNLFDECKRLLIEDLCFHFNNNFVKADSRVIRIVPFLNPIEI